MAEFDRSHFVAVEIASVAEAPSSRLGAPRPAEADRRDAFALLVPDDAAMQSGDAGPMSAAPWLAFFPVDPDIMPRDRIVAPGGTTLVAQGKSNIVSRNDAGVPILWRVKCRETTT